MKIKLLVFVLLASVLLSACGSPATATPAAQDTVEAPEATTAPDASRGGGGPVTLILPEEPTTLNYFMADAAIARRR